MVKFKNKVFTEKINVYQKKKRILSKCYYYSYINIINKIKTFFACYLIDKKTGNEFYF